MNVNVITVPAVTEIIPAVTKIITPEKTTVCMEMTVEQATYVCAVIGSTAPYRRGLCIDSGYATLFHAIRSIPGVYTQLNNMAAAHRAYNSR